MTETYHPGSFSAFFLIGVAILVLLINISVSINLYNYSKKLYEREGTHLMFIHSVLWIPIDLLSGMFAAVLVSLILSIQRR
jgi:hypothetical protein